VTELPASPYRGLAPFDDSDVDALFFFGRERDTEVVAANLIASKLTVLYGPSGVGKTSLLRAGVARELRGLPEGPLVLIHDSWVDDAANGAVIADAIDAAAARDVYLVLDQLEEYFLLRGRSDVVGDAFPDLVNRRDVRVHVAIGIRDDALASLDTFKTQVPALFGNYLRLDHLDRDAARSAIVGPVRRWNELAGTHVEVEDQLVEAVLNEVTEGRLAVGGAGRGRVEGPGSGRLIETPYLQLVMERLWADERAAGSDALRLETFVSLGGAASIVRDHLEGALATLSSPQKEAAARMFDHLVTPSGTKIAHGVGDLAEYARAPTSEVEPVVHALAAKRILRPVANGGDGRSFEIFHDVLADAVLDWRTRWDAQRGLEQARAEAERRRRVALLVAGAALVGLAAMTVVAIFALAQRREARSQERIARTQEGIARSRGRAARTRELVANALTQLPIDPQRALGLAVAAAAREHTPATDDALRRALRESRLRRSASIGAPVRGLAVTRDGRVVAATRNAIFVLGPDLRSRHRLPVRGTFVDRYGDDIAVLTPSGLELRRLDGSLRKRIPVREGAELPVRNLETGELIESVRVPKPVRLAALGPKGTLLALAGMDHRVVVLRASGEARYELQLPAAVTALAFGTAARRLAIGLGDGTAGLWRVRDGHRLRELPGHRGPIRDVAFSPRATRVATASNDGTARVWNARGGLVAPLAGHSAPVLEVGWSPDGRAVATGSTDGTARVWKADTAKSLAVLRGVGGPVATVAFTRGSSQLVTGGRDGIVRLWDVREQPRLRVLARFGSPVARVAYVGADEIDAVTRDGRLHVLDRRGRRLAVRRAAPAPVARASDGATAEPRGNTVVVRRPGGRVRILHGHHRAVTSVHFSRDGRLLVSASRDRTARTWDARTGDPLRVFVGHFGTVRDAVFSPDGMWVLTAGPGTAELWATETAESKFQLQGHRGALTTVAFDRAGERILTGGRDGTVQTYECEICRSGDRLLAAARSRRAQARP
jgi:WD40 repeat protein